MYTIEHFIKNCLGSARVQGTQAGGKTVCGETPRYPLLSALKHPIVRNHGFCTYTATLTHLGEGLYALEHCWAFWAKGKWRVQAGILCTGEKERLFAPTVLYRNNDRGEGAFLHACLHGGFSIREERTPLPGCLCVYTPKTAFFVSLGTPDEHSCPADFSVYAQKTGNKTEIGLQLPATERPFSYQGKTRQVYDYEEPAFTTTDCTNDAPRVLKRTQYVYIGEITEINPETGMLRSYRNYLAALGKHKLPQRTEYTQKTQVPVCENNTWLKQKLRHLYFLLEKTERGSYLKMGKGNGTLQPVYEFTGASFLVKSLEAAVIFAHSGDDSTAESIGRFFLQAEQPAKSGVYRDNHNLATGEWGGYLGIAEDQSYKYLVNARCNGEAMLNYIRLYEILQKKGITVPEFIELPKRVARFYLDCQCRGGEFDGCFGRWWTAEGKAKNLLGTNGAYIVLYFLQLAAFIEKNSHNNEESLAAELRVASIHAAAYYLKLIDNADFYGDTLDADSYDKESAAVLLRMCLDLYETTAEEKYKTVAIKAADFALTWIWQYNIPFPADSPLTAEGFNTVGMTAVSTAHHHLDFYGMYLARDFLRLEHITANPLYGSLARDMIRACLQLTANTERPLGKGADFTGWQPEQINHTLWDYFDRIDQQRGTYDICIAWVPVLTLGAFYQIKEEQGKAF